MLKVPAGIQTPLPAETAAEIALLTAFVSSLPSFAVAPYEAMDR
jgi:hypothetical protein